MQASEIYELGCKAYNGDQTARKQWFEKLAPLAKKAAKPYKVLPGIILARAALESGWGSDLYELTMEKKFGVAFARKAQKHNNLVGMVAYGGNDEYAPKLTVPAWAKDKAEFEDWAPHGDMSGDYKLAKERWKGYESIEHCFQDFAAVIVSQAYRRGESWPSDLRGQLRSMGRGYTPEGAPSDMGMDFAWQDKTLNLYTEFELWRYDGKKEMEKVKMTIVNLLHYIKAAYEYTRKYCTYGPSGTRYPPASPPERLNDCVGLIFLALWMMGRYPKQRTINEVIDLCEENGLFYSTDINDVWLHPSVVCFRHKHNRGRIVNHVFYSLGGTGLNDISKYDLGSNERIRAAQPFTHVPVDEWPDTMDFLCCLYLKENTKLDDVPAFASECEQLGTVAKSAGMYAGPGPAWRRIGKINPGEDIILGGLVTNGKGNLWRVARIGDKRGYVPSAAVTPTTFKAWNGKVAGTDGSLALRIGAGGGCPKTCDIPEGTTVRVDGKAVAGDGGEWYHVKATVDKKPVRGFVAARYVIW